MLLVKPTPSIRVMFPPEERDTDRMSRSKKLKKPTSKKKNSKKKGRKTKEAKPPWEKYKARDHGISRVIYGTFIIGFLMPIWAPFAWAGPQYMNYASLKLMETLLLQIQQLH